MREFLVGFRKSKELTQLETSKKLGVSLSFYSKVETGERNPSYNFIKRFKEVFPDANVENFFKVDSHAGCKC